MMMIRLLKPVLVTTLLLVATPWLPHLTAAQEAGAPEQESAAPSDGDEPEAPGDDGFRSASGETGFEVEEDEWAALDRELQGLSMAELEYGPQVDVWAYVRSSAFWLKSDAAGVNLDNVRLNFTGQTGSYSYRLTGEFASGQGQLLDAWLSTPVGEELAFTFGRFRSPFLRSGLIEARDLLFIARTRNGIFYSRRDDGLMVNGDHGRFHWAFAGQNGASGTLDRHLLTGQVKLNLIGEPELPWEGAYRAGEKTRLTLGAAISNDDAASDGTAYAAELYLLHRGVSVAAEIVDYDADYSLDLPLEQRGNTTPWTVTASYMIVPEKYEVALRYDDFDDTDTPLDRDRRTLTLGLNRYVDGHDLKWQFNYAAAHKGGDEDGPHDAVIALGLTASF